MTARRICEWMEGWPERRGGGGGGGGGGLLYQVSLRAQEKQEAQEVRRSLPCCILLFATVCSEDARVCARARVRA